MENHSDSMREKIPRNATSWLNYENIIPGETSQLSKAPILYGSTYMRYLE